MNLRGGEMYAYQITGGSNLDLPDLAVDADGQELSLERDIYPNYDLILCISTYSATAPLTAFAKQYGFRGATLHGVNPIILASGLSVDYNEVSRKAEKLRLGVTRAEAVEIDFGCQRREVHACASNSAVRKRRKATASASADPTWPISRPAKCISCRPARTGNFRCATKTARWV